METTSWAEVALQSGRLAQVTASIQEQHLLLRLLDLNSERVPDSYQPSRGPYETLKRVSFIVPIEALRNDERDSMGVDGCAVCGKVSAQVCGSCRSLRYCSKGESHVTRNPPLKLTVTPFLEHAKSHWKFHKLVCKKIANATWASLPFKDSSSAALGFSTTINWNYNQKDVVSSKASGNPPPNNHGSNVFLIKMQMEMQHRSSIMIYDQSRAFQIDLHKARIAPDIWNIFDRLMLEKGISSGLKIFLWAKRKSEWELSVAIDPTPNQTVGW